MHLFLYCLPDPRTGSAVDGRGLGLMLGRERGALSCLLTWAKEALRSWTCLNTDWTPLDWAGRHVARIKNRPESAVERGTVSEGKTQN